jgi:Pin2-interacting protein X1
MVDEPLKDTLNKHWKEDKSRFGFKMLQKMGWSEDKGLGKNENGIVCNVKTKKRDGAIGLGMDETVHLDGNVGWNNTANSFNEVLNMLKENYGVKKKKDKKKKVEKSVVHISVGMK